MTISNHVHHRPALRRFVVIVSVAALLAVVGATARFYIVSYSRTIQTIDALESDLGAWQRAGHDFAPEMVKRIDQTIRSLKHDSALDIQRPHCFAAYITPGSVVDPEQPPVLSVLWLEDSFDADGIDIYVDGKLHETVTGWAERNRRDGAFADKFGKRPDRFIYLDIATATEHNIDNSRDVITLSPEQLNAHLEVRMRTDHACGPRVTIFVEHRVLDRFAAIALEAE